MRALLTVILLAAPACARLCESGTFWSGAEERCAPCRQCGAGEVQLLPCQPFQDTVCSESRRTPPPPVTDQQAHRNRLAEERVRLQQERAKESLHVERTQLETLVVEWETIVFVVSIVLTFALVFSCLALLLRRTSTAVSKGVESYSHLLLNQESEHRDANDQGSLAFADFNAIKIGRRGIDSPYSDLSAPRSEAGTTVSAVYSRV